MPDPLADVSPGQKVRRSAERENAWSAAARQFRSRGIKAGDATFVSDLSPTVIEITNTGDEVIDIGGVVGLNDLIYKPADDKLLSEIGFEADAPTQENADRRQLAIAAEPANPGNQLSSAYLSGVFPAKIDVVNTDHQFARVIAGDTQLRTHHAYGEFRILSPIEETGDQWAIVTPCNNLTLDVKITGDAEGGEKYTAKTMGPVTSIPSSGGDLTEAETGTVAPSDDCLFQNREGVGRGTHMLTEGTDGGALIYGTGTYTGTMEDGTIVVSGFSIASEPCTDTGDDDSESDDGDEDEDP